MTSITQLRGISGGGSGGGGLPNPPTNDTTPTVGAVPGLPGSIGEFGETVVANQNPDGWLFKDYWRRAELATAFDPLEISHPLYGDGWLVPKLLGRMTQKEDLGDGWPSKVNDHTFIAFYKRQVPMSAATTPPTMEMFAVKFDRSADAFSAAEFKSKVAQFPSTGNELRYATIGSTILLADFAANLGPLLSVSCMVRYDFDTNEVEVSLVEYDIEAQIRALIPSYVTDDAWYVNQMRHQDGYSFAAASADRAFATFAIRWSDPLGVQPDYDALFGVLFVRTGPGVWTATVTLLRGGGWTGAFGRQRGGCNVIYAPTSGRFLVFGVESIFDTGFNEGLIYCVDPSDGLVVNRVIVATTDFGCDYLSPINVHTWGGVEYGCCASASWRSSVDDDRFWATTFHMDAGQVVLDDVGIRPPAAFNLPDYEYEGLVIPDWESATPRWTVWTRHEVEPGPMRWVEFSIDGLTGAITGSGSLGPWSESERYGWETGRNKTPFYLLSSGGAKTLALWQLTGKYETPQHLPLALYPRHTAVLPSDPVRGDIDWLIANRGKRLDVPMYIGGDNMIPVEEDYIQVLPYHAQISKNLQVVILGRIVAVNASINASHMPQTEDNPVPYVIWSVAAPLGARTPVGGGMGPWGTPDGAMPAFLADGLIQGNFTLYSVDGEFRYNGISKMALGPSSMAQGFTYAVKKNTGNGLWEPVAPTADLAACTPEAIAHVYSDLGEDKLLSLIFEGDKLNAPALPSVGVNTGVLAYVAADGTIDDQPHATAGAWQFIVGRGLGVCSIRPFRFRDTLGHSAFDPAFLAAHQAHVDLAEFSSSLNFMQVSAYAAARAGWISSGITRFPIVVTDGESMGSLSVGGDAGDPIQFLLKDAATAGYSLLLRLNIGPLMSCQFYSELFGGPLDIGSTVPGVGTITNPSATDSLLKFLRISATATGVYFIADLS